MTTMIKNVSTVLHFKLQLVYSTEGQDKHVTWWEILATSLNPQTSHILEKIIIIHNQTLRGV